MSIHTKYPQITPNPITEELGFTIHTDKTTSFKYTICNSTKSPIITKTTLVFIEELYAHSVHLLETYFSKSLASLGPSNCYMDTFFKKDSSSLYFLPYLNFNPITDTSIHGLISLTTKPCSILTFNHYILNCIIHTIAQPSLLFITPIPQYGNVDYTPETIKELHTFITQLHKPLDYLILSSSKTSLLTGAQLNNIDTNETFLFKRN